MGRNPNFATIVRRSRPFMLTALNILARTSRASPYAEAIHLLGTAAEHLIPNETDVIIETESQAQTKLLKKIRKTRRKLTALGDMDPVRKQVLQARLARHLDQL